MEPFDVVISFDDFERPSGEVFDPSNELACISPIGPYQREPVEMVFQTFEHKFCAVAVLNTCFMDYNGHHQCECIYDQLAFPSVYFLARIISAKPPFSVVFTDWLSMMAALGLSSRPCWMRS